MHDHVQYMLYGGSNPSRIASCKMTKTFSWQKSLVKKWPTFSSVIWLICVSFIFQTKPSLCCHLHSLVSVCWIQYYMHETVLPSSYLILPLLLVVAMVVTVVVVIWLHECWTLNHYCAIVWSLGVSSPLCVLELSRLTRIEKAVKNTTIFVIRGLLEKYPTFGREKETGLPGALDT